MAANNPPPNPRVAIHSTVHVLQTREVEIRIHRIEDREFASLLNVSRPITLAVAGVSGGGVLGLLPSIMLGFDHLSAKTITASDVALMMAFTVCVAASVITWPLAVSGQIQARTLLRDIRSRQADPV